MIFIKATFCFIFQVLLIIFVNLFVADITISYIYVSFIAILTRYDTVSILGIDVKCVDIYIILLMVITILKYISLPILYNILYKISKNRIILGFIQLLKTNLLFKIFILFLALAPGFLLILIYNPEIDLVLYLYIYIYMGLFGSYLFLFFWWQIEKWWKSDCDKWYGSKRIKNTQLYLKISKIFNKIQDFNYQNFKKCQKIVFVIVTLICKWGSKVGLKINKVLKTKII